jgi:hypothetical protein
VDLDGALAWVKQLPPGRARENAFVNLSQEWAQANPRAAAEFAGSLPPGGTQSSLLNAVANQWATADPVAAIKWAQTLPAGEGRDSAVGAAVSVWAGDAPEAAAAFVSKLPAGDTKLSLLHELAMNWTQSDPDGALKWAQQLPAAEQARAYDGIVPALANDNPAAAIALLNKLTPENREGTAEMIAAQWLQVDPAAARAWIATAPLTDEVKQRLLK